MNRSFTTIILAGGIRPSPLREQLMTPVLCLPVSERLSLLGAWLEVINGAGDSRSVRIVVSEPDDVTSIRVHAGRMARPGAAAPSVDVAVEQARWRGTGGIVRDVVGLDVDAELVLIVEAACLPPSRLDGLFDSLCGTTMASVGTDSDQAPAGVYAMRREAIQAVPSIGFFDFKEQLLPALYERGEGAAAVTVTQQVIRLRDRAGYLRAVRSHGELLADAPISDHATALRNRATMGTISGVCLVGCGAVIEPGAVVHDSVILDGAVVGRSAVISRSVVGFGARVPDGHVIRDSIEPSRLVRPRPDAIRAAVATSDSGGVLSKG